MISMSICQNELSGQNAKAIVPAVITRPPSGASPISMRFRLMRPAPTLPIAMPTTAMVQSWAKVVPVPFCPPPWRLSATCSTVSAMNPPKPQKNATPIPQSLS